jgi:hypothetical protein
MAVVLTSVLTRNLGSATANGRPIQTALVPFQYRLRNTNPVFRWQLDSRTSRTDRTDSQTKRSTTEWEKKKVGERQPAEGETMNRTD